MKYGKGVLEAAIAISDAFFSDKRARKVIRETHDRFGLYALLMESAVIFDGSADWDAGKDWISSTEKLADNLHRHLEEVGEYPEGAVLEKLVRESVV